MREVFLIIVIFILKADGQCEFPSIFASSTWLDSTRGTLTFGTTTMSGWSVTVFNQQRSTWECVDSSESTTLVMKATQSISYSTSQIYIFMCMKLTQITAYSYSYRLQQVHIMVPNIPEKDCDPVLKIGRYFPELLYTKWGITAFVVKKDTHFEVQQPNAGFERLWFSSDSTLSTVSTICDTSASIPTLEFHVLVKQGMAASTAITFPDFLLFSGDYRYMASTGTIACNGSDTMDMCSDTTALSFHNYTNCNQEIAYSADGELWCVAKSSLDSYDCAVVYNRDETISGTASQFACLCSDGSSVSVVSGNCTSDQVASSYPTAADGTTVIGYLLTIETIYAPISSDSSSSNLTVIIVVVVVILVIIIAVVLIIILYKRGHCVTICDRLDKCLGKTTCWHFCRSNLSPNRIIPSGKTHAKVGTRRDENKLTKGVKEGIGKGERGKGKDGKAEESVLEYQTVGKGEEKVVGNEEDSPTKEKVDKGGKKNKNKAKVQPQDSPRPGAVTLIDLMYQ